MANPKPAVSSKEPQAERLQKILSRAGFGSRRACEVLIQAGRVSVNGKIASVGSKADLARDEVMVDNQKIAAPEKKVYIALYKPRGYVTTVTPQDSRSAVRELVDINEHIYPVGRLDVDSEGLVLMTNDGELANRLTHPRFGHEKEYRVLVARRPDPEQLDTWRRGVVLPDGFHTSPATVFFSKPSGKGAWLTVLMGEGHKRQIRETAAQVGLPVVRLIRVRIGTLRLGNLKPREWRYLTDEEISELSPSKPVASPSKTARKKSTIQK